MQKDSFTPGRLLLLGLAGMEDGPVQAWVPEAWCWEEVWVAGRDPGKQAGIWEPSGPDLLSAGLQPGHSIAPLENLVHRFGLD